MVVHWEVQRRTALHRGPLGGRSAGQAWDWAGRDALMAAARLGLT